MAYLIVNKTYKINFLKMLFLYKFFLIISFKFFNF